ncbi:MAG TPA: hypothetical protein VE669_07850 [Actinomycetota bacterium]|jgi:hypothetical protein|nr:hypothetical protein [Actinomycetota bacterium]
MAKIERTRTHRSSPDVGPAVVAEVLSDGTVRAKAGHEHHLHNVHGWDSGQITTRRWTLWWELRRVE